MRRRTPLLVALVMQPARLNIIVLGLVLILIGAYIYFVVITTFYAADRGHLEALARERASDLSSLEQKYLEVGSELDLALAANLGLHDADSETQYISRRTTLTAQLLR